MFSYYINIDKHCNPENIVKEFLFSIEKSGLPNENTVLLSSIVCETIKQIHGHLLMSNTKKYTTKRAFEGIGYRVIINARSERESLFSKILSFFRIWQ